MGQIALLKNLDPGVKNIDKEPVKKRSSGERLWLRKKLKKRLVSLQIYSSDKLSQGATQQKLNFCPMQQIGEILKEKNIILKGADALSSRGYTQVPNHILENEKISAGAKLVYAMLLKYAWQNDFCFPGQSRLGNDMGVTERSVRTYLYELRDRGFLTIKRRGQGKPNVYILSLIVKNKTVEK